jgi:replicative DNA helicase
MTTDFQKNLLKYLIQTPEGNHFFPSLDSSIFDLAVHKIAFDVLSKYYKSYGRLPGPGIVNQLLDEELKDSPPLPDNLDKELIQLFDSFQVSLNNNDHEYVRDTLIKFIQEKKADQLIMAYGEHALSLDQLSTKIGVLASLKRNAGEQSLDNLLIQDRHDHIDDQVDGAPTFLHGLNALTSARGFYSPQLIIFLSGPKQFKTGFILKLAVEYARDGYNVYYADGENGRRAIRNRAKMAIMECTLRELYEADMADELDITMANFHKYMGGDIFIDFFPAGTATINDVKNRLAQIKETKKFVPDIIIWDSIDHFLPSSPADQKRDTRIQIQKVYHEAIALNNELKTFAIAPSQVNKVAVSKKVFDVRDLAEDFGKSWNAHAIFAVCGTEDEIEMGIRRILPVVQREGQRYNGHNHCIVSIDESRMVVKEVDKDEYNKEVTDD